MTRFYDLIPTDGRKSFYGKAKVLVNDNTQTLYSYDTAIMILSHGVYYRLWDGWTSTTGRHIKAFSNLNKQGYFDLPKYQG